MRTVIEQHQGTHPATGLRYLELVTVTTDPADCEGYEDNPDEEWLADLHAARVALASLDLGVRERATEWLADHSVDLADEADWIRRAIEVVREEQLDQLRLHAVNDVTRRIATEGCTLTHDEADELGEETLAWMRTRLGLRVKVTDAGVECRPRVCPVCQDGACETKSMECGQ